MWQTNETNNNVIWYYYYDDGSSDIDGWMDGIDGWLNVSLWTKQAEMGDLRIANSILWSSNIYFDFLRWDFVSFRVHWQLLDKFQNCPNEQLLSVFKPSSVFANIFCTVSFRFCFTFFLFLFIGFWIWSNGSSATEEALHIRIDGHAYTRVLGFIEQWACHAISYCICVYAACAVNENPHLTHFRFHFCCYICCCYPLKRH